MLIRELERIPDLLALHHAAPARFPCLLESAAHGTARARYDLLFASDGTGLRLDAGRGVQTLDGRARSGGFLEALDAAWRERAGAADEIKDGGLPFAGGWVLLLGYELAGEIEPRLRLPAADLGMPIALTLRCPAAVVVDRAAQRAFVVAEPTAPALFAALCTEAATVAPFAPLPLPGSVIDEDPPSRFIEGVERVLEYLRAGDVFQVNLSRRWQAAFPAALQAAALYQRLRSTNPAPFGGLLAHDDWTLLSTSPERLVRRHGSRIETRPIAGTRPRDAGDDELARVRELAAHPKERAEHIMLLDLERNDLGRVCVPGSVAVEAMMEIESYAHVHHIESTVAGRARAGLTPGELIRAVFPGGTITGCPKVRCMEIIAELEGVGRGPYTGALGWLDRRGDLDLNILIRTGVLRGDRFTLRAGAGIVIDSDPERELAETRAKARGLLRALARDD